MSDHNPVHPGRSLMTTEWRSAIVRLPSYHALNYRTMVDWQSLSFNICAFIAGLFLLEFGADRFIDHTAIVARRLGVSQTLIALLTAGAEWEELAVVIAALIQHKSPLALGNVVGSSISNILGAFSLGLLFHPGPLEFGRSSKIYTAILLLVTSAVVCLMLFGSLHMIAGGALVALFAVYVSTTAAVIYRGILAAPEDSDDESNDGSQVGSSDNDTDSASSSSAASREQTQHVLSETSALLAENGTPSGPVSRRKRPHRTMFHIAQLFAGFLALSISGYVLSHSASAIADAVNLSGTVLGITVLSFATTLPEKFVAVVSSSRGHGGIVVASTAGSNIFLLTLCLGVVALSGDLENNKSSVVPFELAALWFSSVIFFLIVLLGSRRWVGGVLVVLYVAFLVLEFTAFRR